MLKLWLFADTHLYARDPMPDKPPHTDQKTLLESGSILDAALAEFLAEPDCDILLICGDLTSNGHADEHRALIEKLRRVQAAGKRVIAITATHDYGSTKPNDVNDSGLPPLERPDGQVFRHELRGLYDEFGFRDAIARYEADDGMSYVAQLAPGVRLLCLNDDGEGRAFCGYSEEQTRWIFSQIERAKEEGAALFAMTHHPTLPPTPVYPLISQRDMLGDWQRTTRRLAGAGLRCMFSGHSHMMHIGCIAGGGSPYWDVNTASLVGYPGAFRVLELDGRRLKVSTRRVGDFALDQSGLPLRDYLARHFDVLLRDIIEGAAGDIERLASHAGGFSVEKEVIYKYRLPITIAGKYINRVTLGGLARLLCCRIPKAARKVSAKELFLELVRNIYAGEEHYSPDTPVGLAIVILAGRLQKLLGRRLKGTPFEDLVGFAQSVVYDPTPDWAIEIEL